MDDRKKNTFTKGFAIPFALCAALLLAHGTSAEAADKTPKKAPKANAEQKPTSEILDHSAVIAKAASSGIAPQDCMTAIEIVETAHSRNLLNPVLATSRETQGSVDRKLFMMWIESGVGENMLNKRSSGKGVLSILDLTMAALMARHGAEAQPMIERLDPEQAGLFHQVSQKLAVTGENNFKGVKSEMATLRLQSPVPSLVLLDLYLESKVNDLDKLFQKRKNPKNNFWQRIDKRVKKIILHMFGEGDIRKFGFAPSEYSMLSDVVPFACTQNGIKTNQTIHDFLFKNDGALWLRQMKALDHVLAEIDHKKHKNPQPGIIVIPHENVKLEKKSEKPKSMQAQLEVGLHKALKEGDQAKKAQAATPAKPTKPAPKEAKLPLPSGDKSGVRVAEAAPKGRSPEAPKTTLSVQVPKEKPALNKGKPTPMRPNLAAEKRKADELKKIMAGNDAKPR